MKSKPLIILIGASIIFLAVILIDRVLTRQEQEAFANQNVFPESVSFAETQRIVITREGNSLMLFREDDEWKVSQGEDGEVYSADEQRIGALLASLKRLQKQEVVSVNQENHRRYAVDDETGIFVECFGKESARIAAFWVGDMSAFEESHYFRLEGSDEVWRVGPSVRPQVRSELSDFREEAEEEEEL